MKNLSELTYHGISEDVVEILCNKTHEEWIVMLQEMQPILYYNKNLLKQKYISNSYEENLLNQFTKNTML